MTTNTETVLGIYSAFGRGDIPHIMDQLADDISWDEGIRQTGVPYLQPGRGKDHVLGFFQALVSSVEFTVFEPGTPCASENVVMVPLREATTNLATGRSTDEDIYVHIWTFGPEGTVTEFRHVGDFAQHEMVAGRATETVARG